MEFVLFPYFMHEYLNYKYMWLVFFFLEISLRNRFLIEDDWFLVPFSYSFYCILVSYVDQFYWWRKSDVLPDLDRIVRIDIL